MATIVEPRSQPMPGDAHVMLEGGPGTGEYDETGEAAPILEMGGLRLTQAQADRLVQRAITRIKELRGEMGIEEGGGCGNGGWAWQRQKNQNQYDNEWEWRKAMGGIFKYSNFSLNISKRYARLMAAKTSDDLVGTDPFFSCMPTETPVGDPALAKQSEGYVQDEISQSNAKQRIKDAEKTALICNEAVVKISFVTNDTHFRGPGTVAVGPFQYEADPTPDNTRGIFFFGPGEPVMTPRGEYIYQKDNFIPDKEVEGLMRLEKEPKVVIRHAPEFAYKENLDQTLKGYTGLDVRTLDFRDFLCPLNVATIHEADINVHLFDEDWDRLKATYRGFDISTAYFEQGYSSGEKAAKPEKGEQQDVGVSEVLKVVHCGDVYMRCNPYEGDPENDQGFESEIWMIIDVKAEKLIWADYLGNHMKKRPFEVIPGVERVKNRWYGVGVFEMLDHKQLYVDTQFNRVNFKSSKSSSVRFRNRNAVAQWKSGAKLVIGDDQIYDIEDPRFTQDNPPLFQVNLTEIDEHAMKLIELMIQAGSTEVGIVGPDDGAMAGLDTTKLATGIKSLERTGNLLMKFTETDHADGIAAILDQCVDVVLEKMDENEIIFREDSMSLVELNRDEIRKIRKSVKLLLTRSRSTETIETARMVIQLCREYYEALTPYERYKLRGEYLRQLKALETPDAAQLLDEVTREEAEAWLKASQKPPDLPPKTSIATKFGDLERSEQEQVLRREGIEPAHFDEVIASRTRDDNAEVKKEAAIAKAKEDAKPDKPAAKK
jgi:hypothetical protein